MLLVPVIKLHTLPARHGPYVPDASVNLDSPTFSREENVVPKGSLSDLAMIVSAPYAEASFRLTHENNTKRSERIIKTEKKVVSFMEDPHDSSNVFCRRYSTEGNLSLDDITTRWYKASEIKKIRKAMHKDVLNTRESGALYLKNFQELYSNCEHEPFVSAISQPLAYTVANSKHRGCESLIFFEIMRSHQKDAIEEILEAQEDLNDLCASPEEVATQLESVSRRLSERSCRLAHTLGIGDADVAFQLLSREDQKGALLIFSKKNALNVPVKTRANTEKSTKNNRSTRYEV